MVLLLGLFCRFGFGDVIVLVAVNGCWMICGCRGEIQGCGGLVGHDGIGSEGCCDGGVFEVVV